MNNNSNSSQTSCQKGQKNLLPTIAKISIICIVALVITFAIIAFIVRQTSDNDSTTGSEEVPAISEDAAVSGARSAYNDIRSAAEEAGYSAPADPSFTAEVDSSNIDSYVASGVYNFTGPTYDMEIAIHSGSHPTYDIVVYNKSGEKVAQNALDIRTLENTVAIIRDYAN